ncbi:hypothetical protein K523DRAFT_159638 [Schizophyllum commune Tattone D]|nr:hypothetical protein K523DRAFT_159638 [Schizophyllum commune Tattone D]
MTLLGSSGIAHSLIPSSPYPPSSHPLLTLPQIHPSHPPLSPPISSRANFALNMRIAPRPASTPCPLGHLSRTRLSALRHPPRPSHPLRPLAISSRPPPPNAIGRVLPTPSAMPSQRRERRDGAQSFDLAVDSPASPGCAAPHPLMLLPIR